MVLYGITIFSLVEEIRAADLGIFFLFYTDDAVFDVSVKRSVHILKLLMERGLYQWYSPDLSKLLFISNTPGQEEAAKRKFALEVIVPNFVNVSRYLRDYLVPQEELEAWVKPKEESWAHGVRNLVKISRQHHQLAYDGLMVSFQLEWQYLQRTVPLSWNSDGSY